MVDSLPCLDRVVPDGMSQVWRRSEVGNLKRRTLNTRLSSGTSEHTSSSSRNVPGRMIQSDLFWYWNKIKMKPTYRDKNLLFCFFVFSKGSFPHIKDRSNPKLENLEPRTQDLARFSNQVPSPEKWRDDVTKSSHLYKVSGKSSHFWKY